MFKASLVIVLMVACVASASLFSHKPTISREFKKINDWLADNLAANEDGFANVRKAAEYFASSRSSMKPKEQEAWELFTSLARVESECSLEGAKLIHRNFNEAAISWPPTETNALLKITFVLFDIQDKTSKRCTLEYEKIVRASDPRDPRAPDALREFGSYWQNYIYQRRGISNFPDAESSYFAEKLAEQSDVMMAKILYHAIGSYRDAKVGEMVRPKLSGKTGEEEPASVETAKSFLKIFYDECDQLSSALGNVIDVMMMNEEPRNNRDIYRKIEEAKLANKYNEQDGNLEMMTISKEAVYLRDTYRKILLCKRINQSYKPDKLAKALIKLSMNKFIVPNVKSQA